MRKITMSDEMFESIYDECADYIINCTDTKERIAYWKELRDTRGESGTLREDRNWTKLIESGIFHDAIGKVDSENGKVVYVLTEY